MSLAHMSDKRVNRATFTGTDLRGARITDLVDKPEIEMEKTVVDSRFSITYAQVPSPIPIQENHALAARVGFFGWIRNRRRHMADAEYRGLFGRRK